MVCNYCIEEVIMRKPLRNDISSKDILLFCVGMLIMTFGSACCYEANLGTGSIGTLVDGVHRTFDISRGFADILISLILMIPIFFYSRDLIGIGTLISLFGIGLSIDFWKKILLLFSLEGFIWRLVMYVIGTFVSAFGMSLYVSVGAGIGSYDASIIFIYRITKLPYKYAKILADFLMLLIGGLLGGTIGIGTVVSIVIGGYISHFFMTRTSKWINKPSPLNRPGDVKVNGRDSKVV